MSEPRKVHPNISRYPFRDFMRDVQEWRKFRDLAAVCPEPEVSKELMRIPNEQQSSKSAILARVSHMMSVHGHSGEDRIFRGIRFISVIISIRHAMPKIKKEFIMLSDGIVTDTPSEVMAAFHEFFLDDPMPEKCDVESCLIRAKHFEKFGIYDATAK